MLLLERSDLAEPDAVLPGARAAARERVVDDVVDELLGRASSSGRRRSGSRCARSRRRRGRRCPHCRPSRSISARANRTAPASSVSGTQTSVARSFVPGILRGRSRARHRGALARAGHGRRDRARATMSAAPSDSAIGLHELEVREDHLLASGRLDEQARPFGYAGARVGIDRGHDPGVHQLDPGHARPGRDDPCGRAAGALDVGERDRAGRLHARGSRAGARSPR